MNSEKNKKNLIFYVYLKQIYHDAVSTQYGSAKKQHKQENRFTEFRHGAVNIAGETVKKTADLCRDPDHDQKRQSKGDQQRIETAQPKKDQEQYDPPDQRRL